MAIKNIIAKGIGFSPGSAKFIPTHGFTSSAETATTHYHFVRYRIHHHGAILLGLGKVAYEALASAIWPLAR